MYCIHCGKEIPKGSSFCIYCGKKQIVEEAFSAEAQDDEQKKQLDTQGDHQETTPPEQTAAENPTFDASAAQQGNTSVQEIAQKLNHEGKTVFNTTEEAQNDTNCPFCGADNCQPMYKTTAETKTKNYSWESGCCGMLLLGPFGLLCGFCGAGSKEKTSSELWWTCMKCGKQHLAVSDGLKKWDNFVSMLPVSACTPGILFLIIHYLGLGIIGLILEIGCIFLPVVAIYGVLEEISEELGVSVIDYLSPGQAKKCLWSTLGAMAIVFVIGFWGMPILKNILGA